MLLPEHKALMPIHFTALCPKTHSDLIRPIGSDQTCALVRQHPESLQTPGQFDRKSDQSLGPDRVRMGFGI
jgi:hypothetical protein